MTNAFPLLLKEHPTPRQYATSPGRYVLRQIGDSKWVTHWQNLDDGGFYWGHYSHDLAEAEEDYAQRVAEWERRYGEVRA